MSSFDEFYKKWKKQKGITTDSNYKNLSDTQKVETANTVIDDFMQRYQNKLQESTQNNTYKQSFSNNKSLWDKIKETADGLGRTGQNIWYGLQNGVMNAQQTIGRNLTNSQASRMDWANKVNEEALKDRIKRRPEEAEELNKAINNPLISGEQIKKEGEEVSRKIQEKKDENSKKIQNNIDSINNPIIKKTSELAPSIGQMIPGFVPGVGAVYMTSSATGSYYDDAKQRGMNEEEATTYSGIMGLMEGATEMIGIENFSKAGKGVKALVKGAGKEGTEQITKTTLKSVLKDYGIGIADNVIQEALIDPIQELTAQTVAGKDKAQWDGIGQKMLQDGINGGLVSAILGGANLGIQSCTGVIQKMNNNQEVTQQELQTAVQDASKQLNVEQMITDSTQQQINKYKDYYTGKNLDNNAQNILNQAQNIINNNSTQNLQKNTTQNQINQQNQQTISAQDKNISNLNMTTPIAEKQVKSIIKDFNESAKQYNIDFNNEDLQEINQMFNKRGIKAYFDENTFKNNNDAFSVWKPVIDEQGKVSGREVVFNPKAKDSKVRVQELAIHELGHDLDLNEVQNMILKDASRKNNWESARKSLESTYREAYKNDGINISEEEFNKIVDEEATMSILQRELGNQEYVNRLVNQNQSIAKKIYNWVIDKLNKFTGGKNEKIFWTDVKNKFETAYNQEFNKNDNTTKFSIAGRNSLDNIKNDNFSYSRGINSYNNAIKLAKQNVDNEQIRQKTGWFQDKNGDWKYEFSDKDMSLKNIKIEKDKAYRLEDILKHDTLFTLYPELKDLKVQFKNMEKIGGNYNKNSKRITLSSNTLKNIKTIEGTLIHEIQHAIQDIEGHELGTSSKLSKRMYYKSLGEIEADNTRARFIDEKYKNKNISNVAPESSKSNPKHRLYDKYMNNRNTIDKIKDSVFKYCQGLGDNNEINQETNQENIQQNNRLVDDGGNGRYVKSKNSSVKIDSDGDAKYIDENQEEHYIYFRFDNEGEFRGKDHKSGVTMWEEHVEDLISDNDESYYDENDNYIGKNPLLEKYGVTQEEYNDMSLEEALKVKMKIGLDMGYVTDGASVFDLSKYGIDFFRSYETTHDYIESPEVHFFTGEVTGEGVDGENVVRPDKILLKTSSKDIKKIYDDLDELEWDLEDEGLSEDEVNEKVNEEFTKRLVDLINEKSATNTDNINAKDNQKFSSNNSGEWQQFIENNYKKQGTGKNLKEYNLPTKKDIKPKTKLSTKENIVTEKVGNNQIKSEETKKLKNVLNPTEISNMTIEDVNTTPTLPTKNYGKGDKQSSFYSNIVTDSKFLDKDLRQEMAKEDNIRYYKGITNKETLEKAYTSLQDGGKQETLKWLNKDNRNVTAEDVAKGWILLKQYQDNGNYQGAVEIAKKMRDMATGAGQTVQAYNILSRLTPEGMFYYAQSELSEAYNKMVEGKSQKWIEENKDKFELTPEDTKFIMDNMKDVSKMEDGYDKKVKLAEIQKLLQDKIPPTKGQSVKAWMRISMLFNPKTQVRNVLGNAVVLPVNVSGDIIASGVDKLISKKTGIRTTGNFNIKNYSKGFGQGLYESYNDFKKGINTRNIEGNKFEISEGKNFKDKGIGKALNRVDSLLSFMLDAGDRGFYEATFTNSINNQLVLNNTTEVTQDMIDIATNEALQRTWQDNNAYTQTVLTIRNALNGKVGNKDGMAYGLGDILIPFAKTPANLTKAIVDYSPVGLAKTIIIDAKKFQNSLENGQYTPQLQHKFVQDLGKGMAGTFLYVLGYALAKSGITNGEADDDKDVKNFMKNSLGISSYSIKIGNKSYTYDWAQPIAAPLSIMANIVNSDNKGTALLEGVIGNLDTAGSILLEQSFLQSISDVLNNSDGFVSGVVNEVLELPARAIPTFSKQIADMVDGTQRTTFEYDKPVQSAINTVISKIPVASKSLPVARDTLGNEIKKYGGENNIWNVMFNPANTNKGELSKAGEEIYRLYKETGETTIFPITAPYYINSKGKKITMTSKQRSEYQKITGKYTEKAIEELLSNVSYKKLSDEKKNELIADIISDSNAKAKYDILNIETEDSKKKRELIQKVDTKNYYDYKLKTRDIKGEDATRKKNEILSKANYSDKVKSIIYANTTGKEDNLYNSILSKDNIDINEYLNYKLQEFESDTEDDGTLTGKAISGSKKEKMYNYVNDMNITVDQKIAILGKQYKLNRQEQTKLYNYINSIKGQNKNEKLEIFKKYSKNFTIYKDNTMNFK